LFWLYIPRVQAVYRTKQLIGTLSYIYIIPSYLTGLISMLNFFHGTLFLDAAEAWSLGFQDAGSLGAEGIQELHDAIMFYLVLVFVGVIWVLLSLITTRSPLVSKYANHGTLIELVWTVSPALLLLAIAFPSFRLLYLLDEVVTPTMTIKVVGHQWYWSYEYSDYLGASGDPLEFDSYMVPEAELEPGDLRLLAVDAPVVVPVHTHIRFIVTAGDVLHDFAVPSLGLKLDACPGRLNQTSVLIERASSYYGQCSELCGAYHAFMPIEVRAVPMDEYVTWLYEQLAG
jgi:cytochrome c oxidase subunit 2